MGRASKNIFELNQKQKRIEPLAAPGLLSISLLRTVQACTEQTGTVAALQRQGGDGGARGWGGVEGHPRPHQDGKQVKVARPRFTGTELGGDPRFTLALTRGEGDGRSAAVQRANTTETRSQ